MNLLPLQAGDVPDTWANIDDLTRDAGSHAGHTGVRGHRQFRAGPRDDKDGAPPPSKVVNLG